MENKNTGFIISFLIFCSCIFPACATNQTPAVAADSISQSELAFYSDSFDSLKEDLWEKAGYVFTTAQLENIRIGDMTIENGRLRIDTKTGGFSKAGLASKFALRGDYDVQIDLQIEFVAGDFDMDQNLGFGALEKSKSGKANRLIMISLLKKGNHKKSTVFSGYMHGGKFHPGFNRRIGNFRGSVRIARTGDQVSTFFKKQGQFRWTKACSLPSTQYDTAIGFTLTNFVKDRNSIAASRSINAWIDNFIINAAQEIVESEI